MKPTPYLLRLDALGLDLFERHDKGVRLVARFDAGEVAGFRDWLRQREPRRPLWAVVELADESFEIEDLPRVRGADRRALLSRRLASWFVRPDLASAETLPQACPGLAAHAERWLFSGLSRIDAIAPWLDALQACSATLERVLPASRLAAHFARDEAATGAVIVHFSRAGMRLTAALGGQALFARLATDFPAQVAAMDAGWTEELARTLHYLGGRRELPLPAELPILIHASADHLADGASAAADPRFGGRLRLCNLPATTAEAADPTQAEPFDAGTTAQLLDWLVRAPPRLGWGASRAGTNHHRQRIRLAVAGLGLCATLAGAGSSVLHWQDARRDARATQQLQHRHAQLRQTLAALETGSAEGRLRAQRLLATLDHLESAMPPLSAGALFHLLAAMLQAFPAHELQTLEWQADNAGTAGTVMIEIELRSAPERLASAAAAIDALRAKGALAPRLLARQPNGLRLAFELPSARLGEGER